MKNNKGIMQKIVAAFIVIAVIVIIYLIMFSPAAKNTSSIVEDTFTAQVEYMQGNEKGCDEVNCGNSFDVQADVFIAESGYNNSDTEEIFKKALKEFDYKILEIKEIDENRYDVYFEIDSYNISDMFFEVFEDREEFLSEEELKAIDSKESSSDKYKKALEKVNEEYVKRLNDVKPQKETHVIRYKVENEEAVLDSNNNFFDIVMKAVIGERSDFTTEVK